MAEEWRPVVGFEGLYEVSDLGRVRSLDRWVVYVDGRRAWLPGVLKKGSSGAHRYRTVYLPGRQARYVQDLVLAAFVGPKPEGMYSLHRDDDPLNNRLGNLYYGTQKSNAADKYVNGGQSFAEDHHNAVFDNELIREVRCQRGHLSSREAAERFGMSRGYVREIWRGEARVFG